MPLWRGGPNIRTLPTVLLTPSASKAADMAHLCVPQNQALGFCRGYVPDIQICGTHGRKDLVNTTIISNMEEEEFCSERRLTHTHLHSFHPQRLSHAYLHNFILFRKKIDSHSLRIILFRKKIDSHSPTFILFRKKIDSHLDSVCSERRLTHTHLESFRSERRLTHTHLESFRSERRLTHTHPAYFPE